MKILAALASAAAVVYSLIVYVFILSDEKKLRGSPDGTYGHQTTNQFIPSVDPVIILAACICILVAAAAYAYCVARKKE